MPRASRAKAHSLQNSAYSAMATQLDRVNGQNARIRIAELEQEIEHVRDLLRLARERLKEKDAEIEALKDAIAPIQQSLPGSPESTLVYQGRAATTPQKAAEWHGVHVCTIIRRLQSGKIAGEQLPGSNRWIVYLDQPMAPFRSRKQ